MQPIEVQATISWHPLRRYVKMPQTFEITPKTNIIDIIYRIDKQYFENRKGSKRSNVLDFMERRIKSALQMLWNSETGLFYGDVGVECRTSPPESISAPVETDWRTPIPEGSWIVLMPDAEC
ncbi:MAG: hypothetical protein ACTSRK_01095 [Promethearchaeota archaeon]